jgi:hypothetical protein
LFEPVESICEVQVLAIWLESCRAAVGAELLRP